MEQSRLRVGGWVDHLSEASGAPTSGAGQSPALPSIDPVGDLTGELHLGAWEPDDQDESYRGRRRRHEARAASPRRVALVAVLVGALLLGVGLLSRALLASDPGPLTAPPPLPQHTSAAPTEAEVRMGVAPTGPASATPESPDQPAPEGRNGGGSTERGGSTEPGQDPAPPPPPLPPPAIQADYEAEHAVLGGRASINSFEGASGGQVVRLWGLGGSVEFGVAAGRAGSHPLTILYSGGGRTVQVSVNGDPVSHWLPGTADGNIAASSLQVQLTSGGNVIRVATSAGPPVYLDGITIG